MKSSDASWSIINYPGQPQSAISYAVASDGKYYVLLGLENHIEVHRYDENGGVDTTFGNAGIVSVSSGGSHTSRHCITLHEGKLLTSCQMDIRNSPALGFLHRLDAVTGALDTTFGHNGTKVVDLPSGMNTAAKLELNDTDGASITREQTPQVPDGKIRQLFDGGFAQFDEAGDLDTSFNGSGILRRFDEAEPPEVRYQTTRIAPHYRAGSHAGFYYCGAYNEDRNTYGWVGVINSQGQIDRTFGNNGKLVFNQLPGEPAGVTVVRDVVQVDDKIYIGGVSRNPEVSTYMLRLRADGQIDTTYNDGRAVFMGRKRQDGDSLYALAPHDDGMLVLLRRNIEAYAVYRVDAEGKIDRSFGENGRLLTPPGFLDPMTLVITHYQGRRVLDIRGHYYLLRHPLD